MAGCCSSSSQRCTRVLRARHWHCAGLPLTARLTAPHHTRPQVALSLPPHHSRLTSKLCLNKQKGCKLNGPERRGSNRGVKMSEMRRGESRMRRSFDRQKKFFRVEQQAARKVSNSAKMMQITVPEEVVARLVFKYDQTNLVHRLSRFLILHCSRLSFAPLRPGPDEKKFKILRDGTMIPIKERPPTQSADGRSLPESRQCRRDCRRCSLLRDPLFWVYTICFLRLILRISFQYMYDANQFRLDALRQNKTSGLQWLADAIEYSRADVDANEQDIRCKINTTATIIENNHLCSEQELIERMLIKRVKASVQLVKTLGAPYIYPAAITTAYMLLLGILLISNIIWPMMMSIDRRIDWFLARILLNQQSLVANCKTLLEVQINEYILSSTIYVRNSIEQSRQLKIKTRNTSGCLEPVVTHAESSLLSKDVTDHKWIVSELNKFANDGRLVPINISQEWVDKMCFTFSFMVISNIIYSLIFDLTIMVFTPRFFGVKLEWDFMDKVAACELAFLVVMSVIAISNNIPLFVVNCANQLRFVPDTIKRIQTIIQGNDAKFIQLIQLISSDAHRCDSGKWKIELLREKMNSNLLLAHLRYRITIVQLKPLHRIFSMVVQHSLAIILVLPFFIRLQVPYTTHTRLRVLAAYFSFVCATFGNFTMFPLADFHKLGTNLHKTMWSLLAHARELNQQCEGIYSGHIISLLHKELLDPDQAHKKFLADSLGFTVTYPTLVQLQYWFSLLVISLYFDISEWRKLFGDRLDDPYGLLL